MVAKWHPSLLFYVSDRTAASYWFQLGVTRSARDPSNGVMWCTESLLIAQLP
jgi:hypothetical protein